MGEWKMGWFIMNQVPIKNKVFQWLDLIPQLEISIDQEEKTQTISNLLEVQQDGRVQLIEQNLLAYGLISEAQVA